MTRRAVRGIVVAMTSIRFSVGAALTAATLLVAPAAAGAHESSPTVRAALDRVVAAGAPGAVALAGGRTATAGVADVRTRRPLRADDRVRIGSITKSFTAVVALQLVGEGRLSLSDTVEQRLPGVLPYGSSVTLRQLLNHTSGVPDDIATPLMEVFHGDPLRVWTPAQVIGLVRDEPPLFASGTGWAYSSNDYLLVGLMIERATGHSLEHELQTRVVRPLRLRHTSFPVRAPGLGRHAARGYSLDLDHSGRPVAGPLRDLTRYSPSFAWASGNGVSDVRDVARFYRALLSGKLLARKQLRQALETVPTGRPGRRYGLGLDVRRTPYAWLVGHEGDIAGFSMKALSSPDGRRQAVVAVNVKFGPPRVDDALDAAMDVAVRVAFTRNGQSRHSLEK